MATVGARPAVVVRKQIDQAAARAKLHGACLGAEVM